MANLLERITVDQDQCGGRPGVNRIPTRVSARLLSTRLRTEQALEGLPNLEPVNFNACLADASLRPHERGRIHV